jgi:hypothetical protein
MRIPGETNQATCYSTSFLSTQFLHPRVVCGLSIRAALPCQVIHLFYQINYLNLGMKLLWTWIEFDIYRFWRKSLNIFCQICGGWKWLLKPSRCDGIVPLFIAVQSSSSTPDSLHRAHKLEAEELKSMICPLAYLQFLSVGKQTWLESKGGGWFRPPSLVLWVWVTRVECVSMTMISMIYNIGWSLSLRQWASFPWTTVRKVISS